MGSTHRISGSSDESLYTRITFDGTRPLGIMLPAFSHVAKQQRGHARSPRLCKMEPHIAHLLVWDRSA